MTKALSEQSKLGQKGVNLIEKIVLQMGSAWTPGGPIEVGIDGYIELFDSVTHKSTGINIAVQSKATNSFSGETKNKFIYWCSRQDIEYWLNLEMPIILVVSRPETDEAYWVSIKDYFDGYTKKMSPRVLFDKNKCKFSSKTYDDLLGLSSGESLKYKHYLSNAQPEELISNLMPLIELPDKIYHAYTDLRKPEQVWGELRRSNAISDGAWILRNKGILSFNDLSSRPWRKLCDEGTIESFDIEEWAYSSSFDHVREFVQLLNFTLRSQLMPEIKYRPREDCYAFACDPSGKNVKRSYNSAKKKSAITVVRKHVSKSTNGIIYQNFRHLAFRGRFLSLENQWYLEITPTYIFTMDGYSVYRFHEELLQGIKRIEGNRAVLSALLFWADYLSSGGKLFKDSTSYLKFGDPLKFEVTTGLDDTLWGKPKYDDIDNSGKYRELLNRSLFKEGSIE